MSMENCDVAVIGGGPAGSTAAALLARSGHRVIMLEKAHHPRFHIGESLLPMNLPLFERLGVLEQVRALGVLKSGADFEADNEHGYNTFAFCRALGGSPPHAYQVWRADFDRMLFEHARSCGASAREGHEVVQCEHLGPRDTLVEVRTDAGESYRIQARYLVDASGRDTFLSARRRLRRRSTQHQSAAIFGHFRGAEPRPGEDAGNISIYRFEQGWMWMIPLPDGVMSVGAVCRPDYFKQRRGRTVEFLHATLQRNAALWRRLGDAFAFLDPVFSSGVYLAMYSAEQAAQAIDAALREPAAEKQLLRRLERRQRRGIRRFSFFIYRFNDPIMARLFRRPSNRLQIEQAVISMLAGDLFNTPRVLWRLQMFKLVYALNCAREWRRWRAARSYRLAQAHARFSGGTTPLDRT